jgi:hypothetical protein
MYLMYVDESGDTGMTHSPTRYFVLTGMVIHELRWRDCLDNLIRFRRAMKTKFGLKLREEFHAAAMLRKPGRLSRIPKPDRLAMIRHFADFLASLADLSVINVLVDKAGKPPNYDVFHMAWRAMIQRLENTLRWRNFPGPGNPDERGSLYCDGRGDKRLVKLMRQMRQYNPVPNAQWYGPGYRNLPLSYIVEDANFRDSAHSYFIQAVDTIAYLLSQHCAPNLYMRKSSGKNYIHRLKPILCLKASPGDPLGIVRL